MGTVSDSTVILYILVEMICGIDECGRGPLAGPIVAAAVVLARRPSGIIRDSKKMSHKQRMEAYPEIIDCSTQVSLAAVSAKLIDQRGISWANKRVFEMLINSVAADSYIIDGNLQIEVRGEKIESIVRADDQIIEVMCASIVAKVARDALMTDLHRKYPMYDFDKNFGYGTPKHIQAILQNGKTGVHRKLFVTTAIKNMETKLSQLSWSHPSTTQR